MDLLIEFAKTGLGIGCVIREFVQEELKDGSLIELPLEAPIRNRTIGFAYHPSAMTRTMNDLCNFVRNNEIIGNTDVISYERKSPAHGGQAAICRTFSV